MYDCVVIGAGLAGGGVATDLAGRGWRVLLLERRVGSHHKVCGEFLSPESQHSFRAFGMHETLAQLAPAAITTARFVSRNGVGLAMHLPGTAWGLSRYTLDTALADGAARAGAEVRTGVVATEVSPSDQGYAIALRDTNGTTTVTARAVVSACGRHPLPGLRPQNVNSQDSHAFVGVKCHWRRLGLPPEVQIYLFDGGYAGLSPIEDGRFNLCMLVSRGAFRRAGATVQGIIAAAAGGNAALASVLSRGEIIPDTVCTVAPVYTEGTPTLWDGYPRVGDAVAMIPPLCGDGMAMALRSAVLCADSADAFLSGRVTLAQWKATYRTAWQGEFTRRLFVGRQLQRLLSLPLLNDALLLAGNAAPLAAWALVRATRGAA